MYLGFRCCRLAHFIFFCCAEKPPPDGKIDLYKAKSRKENADHSFVVVYPYTLQKVRLQLEALEKDLEIEDYTLTTLCPSERVRS